MTLIRRALLLLALYASTLPASASAQVFGRLDNLEARGATYVYARPGEPTIRVSVLGTVGAPGLYEVNPSFDMATLLAFAGGIPVPVASDNVEHRTTVRLVRGETRSVVFEGDWSAALEAPSVGLEDGDQLVVRQEQRRVYGWRDNLALVSVGASLITVTLQIVNLLR